MAATLICETCGNHAPVPADHTRPKMRCPACGVIGVVTSAIKGPVLAGLVLPEPPPLMEGTDDDDGKPYRVPGDPEQKEQCPECKKLVQRGSVVCSHCGFNRETGTKHQRVHEKVDREWEPVLPLRTRFSAYLAIQGLTFGLLLAVVFTRDANAFGPAFGWLMFATLMGFLLGTYPRVNLTRNKKGRVRLLMTWRVAFIPLAPTDVRWHEYEGVITSVSHQSGFWDWLIVLFLLPLAIVPAILWWFYVVRPEQYDVSLTRDHGNPALILYRGRSEEMAKEMMTTLRNVTGLS